MVCVRVKQSPEEVQSEEKERRRMREDIEEEEVVERSLCADERPPPAGYRECNTRVHCVTPSQDKSDVTNSVVGRWLIRHLREAGLKGL